MSGGATATAPGPTGKGWVVELRGFTYHQQKSLFLIESLVENIARYGHPAPFVAADASSTGTETPGATSATTGASPDATASGETKPAGLAAADPVINRVSHVLLFDYVANPGSSSIHQSALAGLMGGGGQGSGMSSGGMPDRRYGSPALARPSTMRWKSAGSLYGSTAARCASEKRGLTASSPAHATRASSMRPR